MRRPGSKDPPSAAAEIVFVSPDLLKKHSEYKGLGLENEEINWINIAEKEIKQNKSEP